MVKGFRFNSVRIIEIPLYSSPTNSEMVNDGKHLEVAMTFMSVSG